MTNPHIRESIQLLQDFVQSRFKTQIPLKKFQKIDETDYFL